MKLARCTIDAGIREADRVSMHEAMEQQVSTALPLLPTTSTTVICGKPWRSGRAPQDVL